MNSSLKKIAYILFPLLFTWNTVYAYTMPAGIPDTSIDFEQAAPARPADWSKEVPGYYYIDLENGSKEVEFGSETQPRKYIPKPIPAGSYVEIAGEYSFNAGGVISMFVEGTEGPWVANQSGAVWVTTSPTNPGYFTTRKMVLWGANAFLTDLTFKDGSLVQVGSLAPGYPASNIVVRNSEIIGQITMRSGGLLSSSGNVESRNSDIVFYNNIIRDAGDVSSELDLDAGLIQIGVYSSDMWVLNNTGYNASGSGVQIIATSGARENTHHIYVGNNEFYDVRQSGLAVKFAKNVVFSSNYIHNIISTPWSVSKAIGAQYEPEGLWIINNRIHDVEYGIRIASTYGVGDVTRLKIYAIGNIIYDVKTLADVGTNNSWESAGIHVVGGHEHYIYNNLIFNAPNGINSSGYSETQKTMIKNNIILDLTSGHAEGSTGYNIWVEGRRENEQVLIENNFLGGDFKVRLVNDTYETTASLTEIGNSNNLTGEISIDSSDLDSIVNSLLSEPLIAQQLKDAGKSNSEILIAEFKSNFPEATGVNLDFLNNERFLGEAIDIGPFEQDDIKINPTAPEKPENVKALQRN